jgi:hypothetical protein
MWNVNPTCGSPRIRDELAQLGLEASTATIRNIAPSLGAQLHNVGGLSSRTIPESLQRWIFCRSPGDFRLLYLLVIITHERRKIVHFNITEVPTAAWTAQQIIRAFPDDTASRYLLRDRDSIYGSVFV